MSQQNPSVSSTTIAIRLDSNGTYSVAHGNIYKSNYQAGVANRLSPDVAIRIFGLEYIRHDLQNKLPVTILLVDSNDHPEGIDPLKKMSDEIISKIKIEMYCQLMVVSNRSEADLRAALQLPETKYPIRFMPHQANSGERLQTYLESLIEIINKRNLKFEEAFIDFDYQLVSLTEKKINLKNRGFTSAYEAASKLEGSLRDFFKTYKGSAHTEKDSDLFNKQCSLAISAARPELEKHRGWAKVLANLTIAVAAVAAMTAAVMFMPSLVIPTAAVLVGAALYNCYKTGSLFYHPRTGSEKLLDTFEQTVKPRPASAA